MKNILVFDDFDLLSPIKKAIAETGYTVPTPIQAQAIPQLLSGRDLLGCAQTGTGKTAAFALPILNYLATNAERVQPKHTRVLVLSPTRELAIQIFESFKTYGKHLHLRYAVVYGGVGQRPQEQALARGVDVVIATPGRLLDLVGQRFLNLSSIETFVLDEADRMLDMGFVHDIKRVLQLLPKERQNIFFSATMSPEAEKLANAILRNPKKVEVTPVATTAELIEQSVMFVESADKMSLLKHLLQDKALSRVILFSRMKHVANRIAESLKKAGISAEPIHGNKSQSARQRALENFKAGRTRVLVATDLAARGIDVDNISHVINYELPNVSESYVHRIGRTARAGAQGLAIAFCNAEEKAFLRDIEKLIGESIPVDRDQPFHSEAVESARVMSSGKAKAAIEGSRGGRSGRHRGRRGGRGQQRGQASGGGDKSRAPQPRATQSRPHHSRAHASRSEAAGSGEARRDESRPRTQVSEAKPAAGKKKRWWQRG